MSNLIFSQHKTAQYNSLNVNLSDSQPNKLKSVIKSKPEIVLRLSSNIVGNSDDDGNS